MKFIVENMGRLLVTVVAAVLVLVSINNFLLPGLRSFYPAVFSREEYYVDSSQNTSGPVIYAVSEVVVPLGSTVNLFDPVNITASSSCDANIMSQLTSDYVKDVTDRNHVFVYKVNPDNSNSLVSKIDTSVSGRWMVVYMVSDDHGSATAKISYVVSDA